MLEKCEHSVYFADGFLGSWPLFGARHPAQIAMILQGRDADWVHGLGVVGEKEERDPATADGVVSMPLPASHSCHYGWPCADGVHLGPAPTRPRCLLVEETAWRVPPPLHVEDNSRSPGD